MTDVTSKIVALLDSRASPTVGDLVELVAQHLEPAAPLRTSDALADLIAVRIIDLIASGPMPSKSTLAALIADLLDESEAQWHELFKGLLGQRLPMAPDERGRPQ